MKWAMSVEDLGKGGRGGRKGGETGGGKGGGEGDGEGGWEGGREAGRRWRREEEKNLREAGRSWEELGRTKNITINFITQNRAPFAIQYSVNVWIWVDLEGGRKGRAGGFT
jgi:hypothetical protein